MIETWKHAVNCAVLFFVAITDVSNVAAPGHWVCVCVLRCVSSVNWNIDSPSNGMACGVSCIAYMMEYVLCPKWSPAFAFIHYFCAKHTYHHNINDGWTVWLEFSRFFCILILGWGVSVSFAIPLLDLRMAWQRAVATVAISRFFGFSLSIYVGDVFSTDYWYCLESRLVVVETSMMPAYRNLWPVDTVCLTQMGRAISSVDRFWCLLRRCATIQMVSIYCVFAQLLHTVILFASKSNDCESYISDSVYFMCAHFYFSLLFVSSLKDKYVGIVRVRLSDWLTDGNHLHSSLTLREYQFYVFFSSSFI